MRLNIYSYDDLSLRTATAGALNLDYSQSRRGFEQYRAERTINWKYIFVTLFGRKLLISLRMAQHDKVFFVMVQSHTVTGDCSTNIIIVTMNL